MKIKEFFIKRYGPLREVAYPLSHPLTLLLGMNEDGKTLTIDALVKLLLGRQVRDFGRIIDRVEEKPEGYCVIEGDDGEEIKLPHKEDLTTITAVTASEYRNVFIIRDSDLSIAGESEFYTTVTNRLMGLRTEEILKTKEALREIGRITPGGMLRDIKDEILKTRVEGAQALVEDIETLAREMNEVRFDELEVAQVKLGEQIEEIRHELERLEAARKQQMHTKAAEALARLQAALEEGKRITAYTEADAQLWRDCERDIKQAGEAKAQLAAKLKGSEKELKEADKLLGEKQRDFRILEDRKKGLDGIKTELNLYEMKRGEGAEREQRAAAYLPMGVIASLLLGIVLVGLILRPSLPFYIAAPLFFIAAVALWLPQLQLIRDKSWLAGSMERIKLSLAPFKLKAGSVEEIYALLQNFDEEHHKKADEIQDITRKKEILENNIAEVRTRAVPAEEARIVEAEGRIDAIRKKTGAESLQAYQQGLKSRQQNEQAVAQEQGILRNLLGAGGKTLQEAIPFWRRELKTLETDARPEIAYTEAAVTQLKADREEAQSVLASLRERMTAFRARLDEIEREANKILQPETEYLHCTTSVDLEAVQATLRAFIQDTEDTRDTVLKVMDIFEHIEAQEQKKVAELFGPDNPVSDYFSEITGGLYEAVLFNQEQGRIEVLRRDGTMLEAEKLSGGAYDQLYLAIRLALGERILHGTTGFFIMDDPFVKADQERLQKQIKVLQRIAQLGWQVLYFSAKDEMKEALKTPIKRGIVGYLEVQGIFQ
jgi:exonuclease SbcC